MTYFAVLGAAGESGDVAGHHLDAWARWRGWWRAAARACSPPAPARLNFGLTYYGQVSNLDVPYLFWGLLALLWCMRAVVEQAPRRFWLAALFAAAAVATKDQAYALFLLSLPAVSAAVVCARTAGRAPMRGRSLSLAAGRGRGAAAACCWWMARSPMPSGFARAHRLSRRPRQPRLCGISARARRLAGAAGRYGCAISRGAMACWPWRWRRSGWGCIARARAVRRAAGGRCCRLLAMVSFTLCFNFAALRSDDRFLLPQACWRLLYIGIAAELLAFAAQALAAAGGPRSCWR